MKKPLVIIALILLVAVPVTISKFGSREAKPVETSEIGFVKITPFILASGVLTYESQVTLVSEILGRVDEVYVKEGDFVKAGQLLLRLDGKDVTAEIDQLKASVEQSKLNIKRQQLNYDSAKIKHKRFEMLRKTGMLEEIKYDEITTELGLAEVELSSSREDLRQARANLERAQQRLMKTEIRSPINGQALSVSIKKGETAVPSAMSIAGGNLMVIADIENIFAEINVDEADVARVSVGQEAWIVPSSFPDKKLIGSVEKIALIPKQEQGQSKSYPVTVRLQPNANVNFHSGMSGRAEILTTQKESRSQLGVPLKAIQYEDFDNLTGQEGKAFVFVFENGRARRKVIETGMADDDNVEILNGLAKKDVVITGPAKTLRFLREGDAVMINKDVPIKEPFPEKKQSRDDEVALK